MLMSDCRATCTSTRTLSSSLVSEEETTLISGCWLRQRCTSASSALTEMRTMPFSLRCTAKLLERFFLAGRVT